MHINKRLLCGRNRFMLVLDYDFRFLNSPDLNRLGLGRVFKCMMLPFLFGWFTGSCVCQNRSVISFWNTALFFRKTQNPCL